MFTGRLSDKVKYKTIVKHKEKNHEQIIVDGEVYIEHRFLKKTFKSKMVNSLFYHRMHQ